MRHTTNAISANRRRVRTTRLQDGCQSFVNLHTADRKVVPQWGPSRRKDNPPQNTEAVCRFAGAGTMDLAADQAGRFQNPIAICKGWPAFVAKSGNKSNHGMLTGPDMNNFRAAW
jgi:hypothetical protein